MKTKTKMKNKMKTKTKMKIKMNFLFCFHFRFCFYFRFYFCFSFHFQFCICFRFCFYFIFLVFSFKFYYGTLDHHRDIVLIEDEENVPRTRWRIGKINKLVIGKDAQVRGAELVLISKTGEKQYANVQYKNLINTV